MKVNNKYQSRAVLDAHTTKDRCPCNIDSVALSPSYHCIINVHQILYYASQVHVVVISKNNGYIFVGY